MLGDSSITVGYGFRSHYGDADIYPALQELEHAFSGADLVIGNLEVMLPSGSFDPHDRGRSQMRGHPQYATALRRVGFDVVNVANNHADQHGTEAFFSTVATLEKAGIRCCGIRGEERGWSSVPVKLSRQAREVGILGYSLRPPQYGQPRPPYAQGSVEDLFDDVHRLAGEVDQVVVCLHWGEEFVLDPSDEEVQIGRALVDAGAAAVLGHHPHVVRPLEIWKDGVIAYSLGNTVSDMVWQPSLRTGIVAAIDLPAEGSPEVRLRNTRVRSDYSLELVGSWREMERAPVASLAPGEYQQAVDTGLSRYRLAAYWHALVNIRSTPRPVLIAMVRHTVVNKLRALKRRIFR